MAIEITESAAKEIKKIMAEQELNPENTLLRVGVKGGGCSGFSYVLDIVDTDNQKESDEKFESNSIKGVCDSKSYLYISNVTIDFKDEINGRGFVFKNPSATSTCGCGSSFS